MFQRPAAHRPEGRSFCYFWLVLKPPYFYIWCRCSILYYLILFNIISIYIYIHILYIYIYVSIYIYIMFLPKWRVVLHSQTTMVFPPKTQQNTNVAFDGGPRVAWSDGGGDPDQASPQWGDQSVDGSLAGAEGQRRGFCFFLDKGRGRLEMDRTPNSMCVYYNIYIYIIILYI